VSNPNDELNRIIPPVGFLQACKRLKKFDEEWSKIMETNPHPKLIPIILEIKIEHYVKAITKMLFHSKKAEKYLRYENQIEVLNERGLFSDELSSNLNKFEEIRNKYAHQMDFEEKRIKTILDGMGNDSNSNQNRNVSHNADRILNIGKKLCVELDSIFTKVALKSFHAINE
jgi:uncharacterized protein YutE (UPF0331/DUF86 family)